MALFRLGKKKEKINTGCDCGGTCEVKNSSNEATVKILGSGCTKCNVLEGSTKEALKELGMDTTIDHVTDFTKIAEYGVMSTPALVVDSKVVSYGKVLKKKEVVKLLKDVRG